MLATDRLTERHQEILRLIVRTHIASGEPVGSRTLARLMEFSLSPASIRNIMADLEEAGLLLQPHTSAGRIPSERGYRYYVDRLRESGRVNPSDERLIQKTFSETDTPEELMAKTSSLLSSISGNIGIVFAPPMASSVLKHIEFLDLGDSRILVILVTNAGAVERKVIRVSEIYSQSDLDRAGRYLADKFSGQTLIEIRNQLVSMVEEERIVYQRMASLLRAWSDTLEPDHSGPRAVYVDGTASIIDQPEFNDVAHLRALFRMFEEKERLIALLDECVSAASANGVRISIGSEIGVPAMRQFTMISSQYGATDRSAGYLGILGPTRMEYERGITVVGYVASVFGRRIHA